MTAMPITRSAVLVTKISENVVASQAATGDVSPTDSFFGAPANASIALLNRPAMAKIPNPVTAIHANMAIPNKGDGPPARQVEGSAQAIPASSSRGHHAQEPVAVLAAGIPIAQAANGTHGAENQSEMLPKECMAVEVRESGSQESGCAL